MRWAVAAGIGLGLAACTSTPSHNPGAEVAALSSIAASPTPPSTADGFVNGAMAMLGQPYHWAGSTPGGFDCSGLVVYAAARVGIALPRTAHDQLRAGSPIERRAVRGGDLVFMRLASYGLHVGIALDSDRFVHAPASGGRVRIDYLNKAPYARAFLVARRVTDNLATVPR